MSGTDYAVLKNGGFMRQKQKEYFSLRLQVVGGNLTAQNIQTIAEVAEEYGKGYVHMTSRQSVEIPFIHVDNVEAVKERLAAGGVKPGSCGSRVRTVTACQGSEICSSGCIDTYALAKKLHERYFAGELPHKFKIGITGCQNNCLKAEENDLGVKGGMEVTWKPDLCVSCGVCGKACREGAVACTETEVLIDREKCINCGRCAKACPTKAIEGESGYLVSFGGLFGNRIYTGENFLPLIKSEEAFFRVADAAIAFFKENANAGERFRFTLQRVGEEEFRQKIWDAYNGAETE